MMEEIANRGARIRRYAERYGEDEVEAFLDRFDELAVGDVEFAVEIERPRLPT